jgi:hypothetical protein
MPAGVEGSIQMHWSFLRGIHRSAIPLDGKSDRSGQRKRSSVLRNSREEVQPTQLTPLNRSAPASHSVSAVFSKDPPFTLRR